MNRVRFMKFKLEGGNDIMIDVMRVEAISPTISESWGWDSVGHPEVEKIPLTLLETTSGEYKVQGEYSQIAERIIPVIEGM
jgi:hypothetical protein